MVLSNRRLYQTGSCLQRVASGALKPFSGTRSVALEDIASLGVTEEKNTGLLASGVFLLFFCLINIQGLGSGENLLTFLSLMGLILVLTSGVTCIIMALVRRKKVFGVEYPGGSMAIATTGISLEALKEFQAQLVDAQCD